MGWQEGPGNHHSACECGWESGPTPSRPRAQEAYRGHLDDVADTAVAVIEQEAVELPDEGYADGEPVPYNTFPRGF